MRPVRLLVAPRWRAFSAATPQEHGADPFVAAAFGVCFGRHGCSRMKLASRGGRALEGAGTSPGWRGGRRRFLRAFPRRGLAYTSLAPRGGRAPKWERAQARALCCGVERRFAGRTVAPMSRRATFAPARRAIQWSVTFVQRRYRPITAGAALGAATARRRFS